MKKSNILILFLLLSFLSVFYGQEKYIKLKNILLKPPVPVILRNTPAKKNAGKQTHIFARAKDGIVRFQDMYNSDTTVTSVNYSKLPVNFKKATESPIDSVSTSPDYSSIYLLSYVNISVFLKKILAN